MDKKELLKIYNLLNGTAKAIQLQNDTYVHSNDINLFNGLVDKIYEVTNDELVLQYKMQKSDYVDDKWCQKSRLLIKLLPIIEYVNNVYIDTNEEVIQKVGALYNSIEDTELQKRCGDILLVASGAFDRVINQATQILEDRVKKKAGLDKETIIGLPLISKAIHSKIENTILKFSDDPNIQEFYSFLFKGIIGVYRNPTHHGLNYECSREDALKFCAYIDSLLKEVARAEVVPNI